jgi:hypothetical protein
MTAPSRTQGLLVIFTLGVIALGVFVRWRFQTEIEQAHARIAHGSTIVATPCRPIAYQEAGSGVPLLAIHGSGRGYDQGMVLAAPLARRGTRVIAMSRFGSIATLTPYRILMTWVNAKTKSVLLAVLMHASYTGWLLAVFPATSPSQSLNWQTAYAALLWLAAAAALGNFARKANRRPLAAKPLQHHEATR